MNNKNLIDKSYVLKKFIDFARVLFFDYDFTIDDVVKLLMPQYQDAREQKKNRTEKKRGT